MAATAEVKSINVQICFTEHGINLIKTLFSMFSDMGNSLPYTVGRQNVDKSKMTAIMWVKYSNKHTSLTKHGIGDVLLFFPVSLDLGNPSIYSVLALKSKKAAIAEVRYISMYTYFGLYMFLDMGNPLPIADWRSHYVYSFEDYFCCNILRFIPQCLLQAC